MKRNDVGFMFIDYSQLNTMELADRNRQINKTFNQMLKKCSYPFPNRNKNRLVITQKSITTTTGMIQKSLDIGNGDMMFSYHFMINHYLDNDRYAFILIHQQRVYLFESAKNMFSYLKAHRQDIRKVFEYVLQEYRERKIGDFHQVNNLLSFKERHKDSPRLSMRNYINKVMAYLLQKPNLVPIFKLYGVN